MANLPDSFEHTHWKSLRKIPEAQLSGLDYENSGQAYSVHLRELQIRPEEYERFFEGNIRPFRSKKDITDLIAKGDDVSLLHLSRKYLTAYGKIGWEKHRKWLLPVDELDKDEKPLQYIFPRHRNEGDHDRFFEILSKLWKHMRNIMFEVRRPSSRRKSVATSVAGSGSSAPALSRSSTPFASALAAPRDRGASQRDITQPLRETRLISPNDQATQPETWSADRTEEAVIKIIGDAYAARANSDPGVFEQLWTRHLARLSEIEQAQGNTSIAYTAPEPRHFVGESPKPGSDATHTSSSNPSHLPTFESLMDTDTDLTTSQCNQFASHINPSPTKDTYLTPTLPQIMTVYITPFSYTSRSAQPYIWLDAPVHPTSYEGFLAGVRLRANVPESVGSGGAGKLAVVLAYGWNDFCCVVRDEQGWRNGFMHDLREAALRDKVGVWRMKVCCVVV